MSTSLRNTNTHTHTHTHTLMKMVSVKSSLINWLRVDLVLYSPFFVLLIIRSFTMSQALYYILTKLIIFMYQKAFSICRNDRSEVKVKVAQSYL